MNSKLALTAIVMFAVVMGIASMTPAMAAKNKVDLCHYSAEETIEVDLDGDGTIDEVQIIPEHWKIISISQNGNAVNAHELNHAQDNGDGTFTNDFQITNEDTTIEDENRAACDALIEAFPPPEDETEV